MMGLEVLILSIAITGLIVLLVSLFVTGIFWIIWGDNRGILLLIIFAVIITILIVCFFDPICIWLFSELK